LSLEMGLSRTEPSLCGSDENTEKILGWGVWSGLGIPAAQGGGH
jgi:hypothetical protein